MRYRKLSEGGDYTIGQGQANFYIDNPEAVAQHVETRLLLITGEWFLDVTEGTPYKEEILGKGKLDMYDAAIRTRILTTQGVQAITKYTSSLNPITRALTVSAEILTEFSAVPVPVPLVTLL
jgi:hypothetical protein